MRFKIGKETDFKLYKKPKLLKYEYGKGFIISIGLFRFIDSGGAFDHKRKKNIELETSISKLYNLTETDKKNYRYFYSYLKSYRYEWENSVLSSIFKEASGYAFIITDNDSSRHDEWTIDIERLPIYYPWVQEEVLSTSRLLNEVFDIEGLHILEKILEYIAIEEEDDKNLEFKFSRDEDLTLIAEGVYKYKYKLGDLFYEKIPESGSINNTPEKIGIATDNALVQDDFFIRLSKVREQLKELFVHSPFRYSEIDEYIDEDESVKKKDKKDEEKKKSESKGFLSRIIDLFIGDDN